MLKKSKEERQMSKIDRVSKSINLFRARGYNPSVIRMSRSFAINLKTEMMPEINKYFVDGRMTILGVPWGIGDIRGFKVEVVQ
jgi:hypothetical protein